MYPLPDPYPAALQSAFGWGVQVTVVGDSSLAVPVIDGELTVGLGSAVSRSMSLDVGGEDFGVHTARDLLQAILDLGGRLQADVVLSVPGAADAVVPMGQYQVQSAKWQREARQGFTLDCLGLGSLLRDHRFDSPRTFAAQSGLARLVALVDETLPGSTVTLGPGISDRTVPETTVDEDRLGACRDVGVALGGQFYELADGMFAVRAETGDTVDMGPVTVQQERAYERSRTYNGVRARSTNEDHSEVYAWATDDDPASPTYWDGPFGKRPRFYASPLLTSTQEAQDAAATILARYLGRHYTVDATTVQNPAVEPGDRVLLVVDGTPGTFRLDEVKVPLAVGGAMGLQVVEVQP